MSHFIISSVTNLVIPVVNSIDGVTVLGGREILNLERMQARVNIIDVSAKWRPEKERDKERDQNTCWQTHGLTYQDRCDVRTQTRTSEGPVEYLDKWRISIGDPVI